MTKVDIVVPDEFMLDLPNISYTATKLFLYFRRLRELSRNSYPNNYAWVRCSQETILKNTGIKSKVSLSPARLELAELGWIADYVRGGYNSNGENTTNSYCIPDSKLKTVNPVLIVAWGGKVESTEELKKPSYVVAMYNVWKKSEEGI